jgi:phage N-6-adenine-methyltransferase
MTTALAVHYSTGKDDWETPAALFNALDVEFGFWLDAAANEHNHRCHHWWGPGGLAADALRVNNWRCTGGPIWLNPPYSRGLQAKFIAKAAAERALGCTTVMLIPARTDTKAFHAHIWDAEQHRPRPGVEVRFLKGRIKFVGAAHGAPFPSMVVVFRGK